MVDDVFPFSFIFFHDHFLCLVEAEFLDMLQQAPSTLGVLAYISFILILKLDMDWIDG